MATVILEFNHEINVSVQVKDIAYYINTDPVGPNVQWESTTTPHWTAHRAGIRMIGPIVDITPWNGSSTIITVDMPNNLASQYGPPTTEDFIMFSKDNKVNLSSLAGYYALTKIKNNSTEKAELFSIAADFVESSK